MVPKNSSETRCHEFNPYSSARLVLLEFHRTFPTKLTLRVIEKKIQHSGNFSCNGLQYHQGNSIVTSVIWITPLNDSSISDHPIPLANKIIMHEPLEVQLSGNSVFTTDKKTLTV